jgi:glucose/arabinose dehydrogenase
MTRALVYVRRWAILCGLATVACGGNTPAAPPPAGSGSGQTINGTERLGWTQAAADAVELATFHYAIYVDGSRSELLGASCAPSASSADFDCSAPLPSMSKGPHTLELAAFTVGGPESARSAPLAVTVTPLTTAVIPSAPLEPSSKSSAASSSAPRTPSNLVQSSASALWSTATASPAALPVMTSEGVALSLERVAGGFADPTDLAFLPDGRVFVAERAGSVRVLRDGQLLHDAALPPSPSSSGQDQLIALAIDPQFDRTHYVYAIVTASSRTGGPAVALVRFREAANTLADRIVLLDSIPASPDGPSASLRFGADGKLFAAFDDAGSHSLAGDLASPNGKILRLNPDGTTPGDQEGGSPVYSYPYWSPRGLDWQPASRMLWIADRNVVASGVLSVVTSTGSRTRGIIRTAMTLPQETVPSSMAFYHGDRIPAFRSNLLVASDEGRHLLRIQIDPLDPTRVAATERLLQDRIGGIRLVGVAPAGEIYVATAHAIGMLAPVQR